jgi:hypothetical protein
VGAEVDDCVQAELHAEYRAVFLVQLCVLEPWECFGHFQQITHDRESRRARRQASAECIVSVRDYRQHKDNTAQNRDRDSGDREICRGAQELAQGYRRVVHGLCVALGNALLQLFLLSPPVVWPNAGHDRSGYIRISIQLIVAWLKHPPLRVCRRRSGPGPPKTICWVWCRADTEQGQSGHTLANSLNPGAASRASHHELPGLLIFYFDKELVRYHFLLQHRPNSNTDKGYASPCQSCS